MSDPIFVASGGGTVNLVDVPTNVHARERFEQALAKGELRIVAADEVVTEGDPATGLRYRLATAADAPKAPAEPAESPAAAGNEPQPGAADGTPIAQPSEPAPVDPGATTNPAPVVDKPGKSASVEAWRAYAVAQGMDADAAAAATKAALVEQFRS